MNITSLLSRTAMVAAIALISVAAAPQDKEHRRYSGRGHGINSQLSEVGLTDAQKEQVRAIRAEFQPSLEPLAKQHREERKALRVAMETSPVNEPAIRAQAARVAQLEADLAVKRAHVAERIRAVLTPEQTAKLNEVKQKREARLQKLRDRAGRRIARQ